MRNYKTSIGKSKIDKNNIQLISKFNSVLFCLYQFKDLMNELNKYSLENQYNITKLLIENYNNKNNKIQEIFSKSIKTDKFEIII